MEASRFGFNLPPAYKFDPTDADIVAHYLLPRAAGFPNPYDHAVIDADLYSCPPWELMRRHCHDGTDQALFFGPARAPDDRKKRTGRAVAAGEDDGVGGTWDGQKSDLFRLVLLRGDGGDGAEEMEITYKRHHLSYYHGPQKSTTSGWVMYDYQIVEPEHLSGTVLSRVKITDRNKKKKQGKRKQSAGAGEQLLHQVVLPPGPDQAGPSNYYEVTRGEEYGGFTGDTGGGSFVGGDSDYMYGGYGYRCYPDQQGGGGGFAAGDFMGETTGGCNVDGGGGGGFAAGDFMGETTGGCNVDGGGGSGFAAGDFMGETTGGCNVDGGGGSGFAAGDFMGETTGGCNVDGGGGSGFAAGDFMGETTGGCNVDGGGDDFLNLDFGCNFEVGDDFCFNFGDDSGFAYPDGSNGG